MRHAEVRGGTVGSGRSRSTDLLGIVARLPPDRFYSALELALRRATLRAQRCATRPKPLFSRAAGGGGVAQGVPLCAP